MKRALNRVWTIIALVSILAWTGAAHGQVVFGTVPDDIVLLLDFEDGNGDTITDRSQYGHDMELVAGKADWTDGQNGGGMAFDGATAFQTPKTDVLASFDDEISIGAWVNPGQMAGWANLIEMDGQSNAEANHAWKVGFNIQRIVFTTYWVKDHFAQGQVELDTWQHLAWTYDGAAARFYIDGAFDSEDVGNGVFETAVDQVATMDIGWRSSSQSSFLVGVVDELWVSNEVKTDAEIADLAGGITLAVDPRGKMAATWGELKVR